MRCQLIHQFAVSGKHFLRFIIALLQQIHDLGIHIGCGTVAAGQSCTTAQILVFYGCKSHQTEPVAHTETGNHVGCDIRCLFNIVRCARCNIAKDQFFCRTSAKQTYQTVMKLFLRLQILLFLRHMHDIAKCAHRSGNNCNFLYRFGVLLQCTDQCVADLMVRNDLTLFLTHDTVFLFLTDKHLFHGCEQILLGNIFPAVLYRHNGSFINHIGKICTNRTACSQCNRIQIHTFIQMYVLRMNLQDLHTSLQVRLIYDNSTVKTSRTQKRLIQNLRTVRSAQYQNTLGSIETIHLRQ